MELDLSLEKWKTTSLSHICWKKKHLDQEDEFPVTMRRRQFLIRPAFAMTINKSQGHTFEKSGIYLPSPIFSYGQLYVAFARATSKKKCQNKNSTDGKTRKI